MLLPIYVLSGSAFAAVDHAGNGHGFKELSEAAAFLGVPQADLAETAPQPQANDIHWSTSLPAHMWKPCSHTYCKVETRATHVGTTDIFGFDGGPWGNAGKHTALRTFHHGRETMGRAHKCHIEENDITKPCTCLCAHESQLDRLGDMFSGFTTAAASACTHVDLWSAGLQCSGSEIPHSETTTMMEGPNVYHYGAASDPHHAQFCQYTCEDAGATCASFDSSTGVCKCFSGTATANHETTTTKAGSCEPTPAAAHIIDEKAALHWYQLSSSYGSRWGRKRAAQLLATPTVYASVAAQRDALEVDINTASESELDTLYGVGPAYAKRIVEYRDASGYFDKVGDLALVSGISQNTVSNMFAKAGATYSRPTVHQCWLHSDKCPNHPNAPVGWRRESWHTAGQTSEAACLKRARDFWYWCGNTDGDVVKARYLATGGTTFVEKVEKCGPDKVVNAEGQCIRTGCWRTVASCPKNPTNAHIGAWVKYTFKEVNEAQCLEQGHYIREKCGLTDGMSAARWYDSNGIVVSSMTATCSKGYEPRAGSGACQKVGCWQKISSCPFQPANFMINKAQPNTWSEDMTKEKCAATAKGTWEWCQIDGPEETSESIWYGVDGEENGRAGTSTTFDASMVGTTEPAPGQDMSDKGEQNCGTAHKGPCVTQWLLNNGCSKDTVLAKPFTKTSCWPCGGHNQFACKFKFQDNQGCGPDDALAKGGDDANPDELGEHHGYNKVNPNPHPSGKCWECGGDDQPRCDHKYASNNGCKKGHSGTHADNKCWSCADRSNVECV